MYRAEQIKQYRALLPERVLVRVESSDDGLWAHISTADGRLSHCYTQAANALELVPLVNDAIQTFFEIPTEFRSEVGYYSPLSDGHIRIEEIFNKLVAMEKQANAEGKSEATLTLKDSELIC